MKCLMKLTISMQMIWSLHLSRLSLRVLHQRGSQVFTSMLVSYRGTFASKGILSTSALGSIPLNTDPEHDRRISLQFEPSYTRSSRHIRLSRKHRRPSRGSHQATRQATAARAHGPGTYVPTGVPPPGNLDASPSQVRGHGQRAGSPRREEIFDSSSSSFNASSTSTSNSEGIGPFSKGKEVDRTSEVSERDIRWNIEVNRNLTAGANINPTLYANRSLGELAIERFLEDGTVAQASSEDGIASDPLTRPPGVTAEDHFVEPRGLDQRSRARRFSFLAGDDNSLPVSSMAFPGPMQPNRDELAEVVRPRSPRDNGAIQVPAPPDVRQPRNWSTISHSGRATAARQLQDNIDLEGPGIVPPVTTPAQTLGSLFVATAVTTPKSLEGQARPTSTGSVVYMGDQLSAAGSRDSTGSRVTVLRDNSGSVTRRHSSKSQATSDLSFETTDSMASPTMSPIPERRSLNPISPTPSARRSKKKAKRGSRGGTSSATSSPALAPTPTDAALASRGPTPLLRSSSPGSGRPAPPRRTPSSTGGSETSVTAGQAARIAAALAVARGQKRRESEQQ